MTQQNLPAQSDEVRARELLAAAEKDEAANFMAWKEREDGSNYFAPSERDIALRAIEAALSQDARLREAEYRRGIDDAAKWHDQRRRDTPDAFEMEFHEASAKAIRGRHQSGEKK